MFEMLCAAKMLDLVASKPFSRDFACCSFKITNGRPYSSVRFVSIFVVAGANGRKRRDEQRELETIKSERRRFELSRVESDIPNSWLSDEHPPSQSNFPARPGPAAQQQQQHRRRQRQTAFAVGDADSQANRATDRPSNARHGSQSADQQAKAKQAKRTVNETAHVVCLRASVASFVSLADSLLCTDIPTTKCIACSSVDVVFCSGFGYIRFLRFASGMLRRSALCPSRGCLASCCSASKRVGGATPPQPPMQIRRAKKKRRQERERGERKEPPSAGWCGGSAR